MLRAFLYALMALSFSGPVWAADAPMTECDALAAHPADPQKVGPGVQWDLMDARAGIRACEAALRQYTESPRLQFQLGRALLRAERRDEGLPYLFEAADQGYLVAFANIGGTYQFDLGNFGEALKWYRRGAELGDVSSQTHLAEMYQEGWGVERDLAEALRWYEPSAADGYSLSQYKIGLIYQEGGRKISKDEDKAIEWFRRAADNGFARAQNDLGWAYETGMGSFSRSGCGPGATGSRRTTAVARACGDFEKSAVWYRRSAEQGWARAQVNLARLYENGQGVERSEKEAVYWYRLASDARVDQIQRTARDGVRRLQGRLNSSDLADIDERLQRVRYVTANESAEAIKLALAEEPAPAADSGDEVDTAYVPPEEDAVDVGYVPPAEEADVAYVPPDEEPAPVASEATSQPAMTAMYESFIAIENANVRAGPSSDHGKVGGLQIGEALTVVGKVTDADWYMVQLADATMGYVYAPLVMLVPSADEEIAVASAEPEADLRNVEIEGNATSAKPERKKPALNVASINFGQYYALVIGNNAYTEFPALKTAVNDAKEVADVLENDYGYNVELLLDATREEIVIALDGYRARLGPEDNMLIYYAGHGYLDYGSERGYWLPVDASPDTQVRWVSNVTITDTLKAMDAKHVMLVVDSCYSGTLTRGVKITLQSPDYIQRMADKRARVVLTSGGLEPVSDSGGGTNHSVFAAAFLDALRENESLMDGTELFLKIRRPVMVNVPQTPEYADIRFAGHEGGDFLFVKR